MSQHPARGGDGQPEAIYIIRHGEKPGDPPPAQGKHQGPLFGVDYQGAKDEHSLLPRGWQRSGALVALFAPAAGPPRSGLRTPATLFLRHTATRPRRPSAGPTRPSRAWPTTWGS